MQVGSRSTTGAPGRLGEYLSEPRLELALRRRAAREEPRKRTELAQRKLVVRPHVVRRQRAAGVPVSPDTAEDGLGTRDGLEVRDLVRVVDEDVWKPRS